MKRAKSIRAALVVVLGAMTILGVTNVSGEIGRADSAAQAEGAAAQSKIAVDTTVVNLDALVTDRDGRAFTGLTKENFRVLDDGKPQTIRHFETVTDPIIIAMVMEYRANGDNRFAYKAASWGSNFIDQLDPVDWVALVTYDSRATVREDFTRNKGQMKQSLSALSFPQFREANLYDALVDTLDRLDRVKGKKAILLISTGDNTLSESTLDETIKRIKSSDVTIFSVGLAEAEYYRAGTQLPVPQSLDYLQGKHQLETFAKLSGGTSWFPRFEGDMRDIFTSVPAFLRSRYSIGFSPENLAYDGKYHKLKVEIVQPDGRPLTVTDAKGKRHEPVVYAREGYTAPHRPKR